MTSERGKWKCRISQAAYADALVLTINYFFSNYIKVYSFSKNKGIAMSDDEWFEDVWSGILTWNDSSLMHDFTTIPW